MSLNNPNNSLLVLPSWYPSQIDDSSGDFIQRHVAAISLYKNEYVLYVVKDEEGLVTKTKLSVVTKHRNYIEEIIYYHPYKTKIQILNKIISHRTYLKIYKKAIKKYFKTYGLPKLIHVHVAQKAGLLAVWAKKKYNIPFILSEHWTAYLPEADLKLSDHSKLFQRWTKHIFKEAKLVTTVSQYLGEAIKRLYPFVHYLVIPNVVNETLISQIVKIETHKKIFVHASTQNYQKNTEAILDAFSLLKDEPDILLQLFGPTNNVILQIIKTLNLEKLVEIKGNVAQVELFQHIKNAQAVILYSRFETFGCVLIEANALGVPVIVSDLPVFKEIITEGVNGLMAGNNNSQLLAQQISKLLKSSNQFQEEVITASVKKYSFHQVGQQFYKIVM